MSQDWFARKRVTGLFCLFGDAHNEVEMGVFEFFPGLASGLGCVNAEFVFQDCEGNGGHLATRFDTSAEGIEAMRTKFPHKILRKDASTDIPSAEEKDLKFLARGLHR
jgi:hypothetical protein